MDNFITMGYLSTLAGCVTVTCILTQFTKEFFDENFPKLRTKYICFLISLITILIYQFSTKTFFTTNFYITLINSIIVGMTSLGAYDTFIKTFEKK